MTFRERLLYVRDTVAVTLGYRQFGKINTEPPNNLWQEAEPNVFHKPKGVIISEFVIVLPLRKRLLALLGGKIQVIMVHWTMEQQTPPVGDVINWVVMPPYTKVNPKLKV